MSNANERQPDKQILSVGDMLREKREAKRLSLVDVSQALRIRLAFLKALEEGKIDQLPGIAYASGFLRAYAEFLGLDVEEIIQRFRREHQGRDHQQELLFPAPVPQSGVPAAVIVFVGFVIVVCGYIGWYEMTGHQKVPKELIPSMPEKTAAVQGKMSPQIASVMPTHQLDHGSSGQNVADTINRLEASAGGPEVHKPDQKPAMPLPVDGKNSSKESDHAGGAANVSPASDGAAVKMGHNGVDAVSGQPRPSDTVKKPEGDKETRLRLRVSAASWIKVQDQDGHVLLQKILQAGDDWILPMDKVKIIMTVGNAGAVVLEQNGKQSKPLGMKGKVLRHFVVNRQDVEKLLTETPTEKSGEAGKSE